MRSLALNLVATACRIPKKATGSTDGPQRARRLTDQSRCDGDKRTSENLESGIDVHDWR
jgi:hypothetical protein